MQRCIYPNLTKPSISSGDLKESAPPPPSLDLRNVMRYFPSAVTVVTGALNSGELFGLTVSAVTSVSLNPPLVLICIRNESTATDLFKRARRYCVNILAEDQQPIAEKFSLQGEAGRFQNLDYYIGKGGSPIIRGCIGYIDCTLVESILLGDHTVFVGQAIEVAAERKPPLLYIDRNYAWLGKTK